MKAAVKRISLGLLVLTLASACATSPTGRKQLMLVSEQTAISASKQQYVQTMSDLGSKGKLVTDPKVLKRVDTITGRLISQAILMRPDTKSWEWSVQVIDDPKMVNAWCMAGGRMAIYTGLIQKVDPTDDELAQVMGHEISHALANHTAERMSVAMASQLGALAVGIASDSAAGMAAAQGAAALAITLPNSRSSETEADRIGIELAAKAGYDPRAAATLWQKMEKAGGGGPPQFLSTHPAPGNRQATLAALAPQMMKYYEAPGPRPMYTLARAPAPQTAPKGTPALK
ncbi:MAG: M48 family metallopeptidase [Chromatiales bacterium]|nr:M48 family metallopeptidase [Chromatiales bacterium]